MAKRKTTKPTKPDVGGPRPDFKPDPRYRAFLDDFLASGAMGAEFPCGDGNRFQIVAALRTVVVMAALPVTVTLRKTQVLVMRTGVAQADTAEEPAEELLPTAAEVTATDGHTDGQESA